MVSKENTRSHEAEFGVMLNVTLAVNAQVGKFVWLDAHQPSTCCVNVGTSAVINLESWGVPRPRDMQPSMREAHSATLA